MKERHERLAQIRFVILESPYDSWGDPRTEELFARMAGLKIRGYGAEYPYGTLAIDTTDLISDHLLICEERPTGLHPILGNKSVSLRKCEAHHLPWPGLSVLEESGAHEQAEAVRQIMADAKSAGQDLRYAGSWTMDPAERKKRAWTVFLIRDLFTAIYTSYYLSLPRTEVLTGGTVRFKVDSYAKWVGHTSLMKNGAELGPVNVAHLAGESVLWTHLREFSLDARRVAKQYEDLWANRLHIKADPSHLENLRREFKKAG